MKNIKYLIISLIIFSLSSCCLIDYTRDIKLLTKSFEDEIKSFYKINGFSPNDKKTKEILEKLGCKIIKIHVYIKEMPLK